MNRFFKAVLLFFFLFFVQLFTFGQNTKKIDFSIKESTRAAIEQMGDVQIKVEELKVFEMDVESLRNQLSGVMKTTDPTEGFIAQIELPHPDGNTYLYNVKLNTTMSEGLQEKFPQIRSYDAYGVDFPAKAKIDITQHGFHAMIMQSDQSTIYIDPAVKGERSHYVVYHRKDFQSDNDRECYVTSEQNDSVYKEDFVSPKSYLSCELRTYRFALAATVEYTDFHGGTKSDALAAQVTTMNRVNGVYERDLAVTMTIIPDNDLIVYEGDPDEDPFTNGNAFAMLMENQENTDEVIGSPNYDIGHVFGTNSGGVAGLGVICLNGQKARGVTGSPAPINDPFDVDYVAHEIGHQFGANHTQNNGCNRNSATAMEPGSASTILGYAGICDPNVQNNSDDHFHGVSLQEMGNRIPLTSCENRTSLDNSAPIITGTNADDGIIIPARTPFALTAFATDEDEDVLSYCWEQMDNEISVQPPDSSSTDGPNFRSISPVNNPTRYFPSLQNLVSNNPSALRWEVIPSVSRTMNFRVTVRDQPLNIAGCTDFTDISVTTVDSAGPFTVLYPSDKDISWNGLTKETITWDVANTDEDPINCEKVDIFLYTDFGMSNIIKLASDVPNTGSLEIQVPNISTIHARVMVMSSSGTFFDISDNRFEIIRLSDDFWLSVDSSLINVCTPEEAVYNIFIDSIDGFDDPVDLSVVGLPMEAVATFSKATVIPADTSELRISNTSEIPPGIYDFTIEATSSTGTKTKEARLIVRSSDPSPVLLLTSAEGVGDDPLTWEESPEVDVTYDIQIANDDDFNDIIDEATGLTETSYTSNELNPSSTFYWRIRAVTLCGKSPWTVPYFDSEEISIFPNPTIGIVTLSWVGEVDRIEVSDDLGKIIGQYNVENNTEIDIDLSNYPAAVYRLIVFSNSGRFIYNVVKL